MTRGRKLLVAAIIILSVGYLSRPDRGGVGRCSSVFGLSELNSLNLEHKPFFRWELFESPKFRFRISQSDFTELSRVLSSSGYSEWERGGVSFGSVSHGWESTEDFIYCKSRHNGANCYWSYSKSKKLVFAITSDT
ncbi:MAG: hypothetical protein ACSHX9_13655 [Luteolibacter sp.]